MPAPTKDTLSKPRAAVDPARLTKFIDSPSPANAARVQHAAEIKAQNRVISWDGEKCDVRAFESRLAPPDDVRVASDRRAPRLLGTSGGIPASGLMVDHHIPVTSGSSASPHDQLKAPLLVQKDGVGHGPSIVHVAVPSSVLLHEQGLLTPAQRRERLAFEVKFHGARRALELAERDERRLHQIVRSRHSTNDVLHAEPRQDADRPVRGEPFKQQLLHHDMMPTSGLPRDYQKKTATTVAVRGLTHDLIFNETPVPWNAERCQHLRNQGHAGRPFDIINGGVVSYVPPTISEKQHARQAHPSIILHAYTK